MKRPARRAARPRRSSHFDEQGAARMVDVGAKDVSVREAIARGSIRLSREAFDAVVSGTAAKGDVLGVARIARSPRARRVLVMGVASAIRDMPILMDTPPGVRIGCPSGSRVVRAT